MNRRDFVKLSAGSLAVGLMPEAMGGSVNW
jgi:hypothetical protein